MQLEFIGDSIAIPASAIRVLDGFTFNLDYTKQYSCAETGTGANKKMRIRNYFLPVVYDVTIDYPTDAFPALGASTQNNHAPVLVTPKYIYAFLYSNVTGFKVWQYNRAGQKIREIDEPPRPNLEGRSYDKMTLGYYNNKIVWVVSYDFEYLNPKKPFKIEIYDISSGAPDLMRTVIIYDKRLIDNAAPYCMLYNYANGAFGAAYYSYYTIAPNQRAEAIWCSTGEFFINYKTLQDGSVILPEYVGKLSAPIFTQFDTAPIATYGISTVFPSVLVSSIDNLSGFTINAQNRAVYIQGAGGLPALGRTRGVVYTLKIPNTIRDNITGALVTIPATSTISELWNNGYNFGLTINRSGAYYLFYASFPNDLTSLVNNYTRLF